MKERKVAKLPLTVDKALTLLEYIARADKPLGISELSHNLGINKSTIYRILQALVAKEYIRQESGTNKYYIGFKIAELNNTIVRKVGIRGAAAGPMEKLAQLTSETVGLAMRDKAGVIYLDQTGGEDESIRIHFLIGARLPFHCTGTGKAMLAFLDKKEQEEIIRASERKCYTPNTITDPDLLRKELTQIRTDGYAFNNGEYQEVVRVVGAPIFNDQQKVVGAVCVAGLSFRLNLTMIPGLGELVKEAAKKISQNLGCNIYYPTSGEYSRR